MSAVPSSPWQSISETLCACGEAPFWHAREERLYWLDAPLQRIWRWHQPSGHAEHWDLPQTVTGMAPCRSDGLLLVMADGIYHVANWANTPMPLARLPLGATDSVIRGGRCDPWGRYWLLQRPASASGPSRGGTLYCLRTRSTPNPPLIAVRRGLHDVLGWSSSPDGRSFVWCDPLAQEVEQATLSNPGLWPPELGMPITLTRFKRSAPGTPDTSTLAPALDRPVGGAMDQAGRYWAAIAGNGRVICIDPQGHTVAEIAAPALQPSGLCFGGPDMRTLFLTTARAHRSSEELARYPLCGGVFCLTVDTPGLPTPVYWD